MDSPQLRAILAGVFFGMWPLFMNKSGLNGNVSSMVFSAVVLLLVSIFAIRDVVVGNVSFAQVSWLMVICAGITGACGLLAFNGMLAVTRPQSVGTLFLLMIIVQMAVPAAYNAYIHGGVSISKLAGFGFACIAAALLTRP